MSIWPTALAVTGILFGIAILLPASFIVLGFIRRGLEYGLSSGFEQVGNALKRDSKTILSIIKAVWILWCLVAPFCLLLLLKLPLYIVTLMSTIWLFTHTYWNEVAKAYYHALLAILRFGMVFLLAWAILRELASTVQLAVNYQTIATVSGLLLSRMADTLLHSPDKALAFLSILVIVFRFDVIEQLLGQLGQEPARPAS